MCTYTVFEADKTQGLPVDLFFNSSIVSLGIRLLGLLLLPDFKHTFQLALRHLFPNRQGSCLPGCPQQWTPLCWREDQLPHYRRSNSNSSVISLTSLTIQHYGCEAKAHEWTLTSLINHIDRFSYDGPGVFEFDVGGHSFEIETSVVSHRFDSLTAYVFRLLTCTPWICMTRTKMTTLLLSSRVTFSLDSV